MNEAIKFLEDVAGYTEKEIPEWFAILDHENEWEIRARRWLDGVSLGKIRQAIADKGGSYRQDEKTRFAVFTLPKQPSEQSQATYKEAGNEITTVPSEQGEYALSKSLKGKLKQLVPCLEDAEGIMFDGFHRKKINPDAWTVKLDHVKTPVDRAMARMTVNFCRRRYLDDEMKNDIGLAAGSGYSAQDIHDITGVGLSTIHQYYPQELKDKAKVEAGKKGAEIREELYKRQPPELEQTVKTQETTPSQEIYKTYMFGLRKCEKCGKQTERPEMQYIDNLLICPECAGKLEAPPKPPESKVEKPYKEKADFRVAKMHPQKSKEEMDLFTELSTRGITPQTDIPLPLWVTTPDGIYPDKKFVYYVHGEPHEKGKTLERDDEIVGALEKQGWTVFIFRHGEGTVKDWADKIQEFLT